MRRPLRRLLAPNRHALEIGSAIYNLAWFDGDAAPKVGHKFRWNGVWYVCTKRKKMVMDGRKRIQIWGREL